MTTLHILMTSPHHSNCTGSPQGAHGATALPCNKNEDCGIKAMVCRLENKELLGQSFPGWITPMPLVGAGAGVPPAGSGGSGTATLSPT